MPNGIRKGDLYPDQKMTGKIKCQKYDNKIFIFLNFL